MASLQNSNDGDNPTSTPSKQPPPLPPTPPVPPVLPILGPVRPMPKDLQRWEATRRKGMARFILVSGVLSWGLPMFFVMTFVVNRQPGRKDSPAIILISAIIWALGGALFGWVIWNMSEKKYQKYLAGQKRE